MTSNAISVCGLRKSYGDQIAVDGIDFDVPAGTVLALLGPNGSGKSTTVNILSTLARADGGRAEVAGHDVARAPMSVRAAIGVTGQFSAVDPWLTGRENLRLMADLHHLDKQDGTTRANALLEQFGLEEVADRPAAGYSGGLQRRLDLAMTLLGAPRVLFLDEPTTGLDPRSRRGLWDSIRSMVDGGMTVLLTTQYLEEADALADRVALLDHGRLVAEGTPQELKALVPGGHIRVAFPDAASLARAAANDASTVAIDESGLTLQVPSDGTAESLVSILTRLDPPRDARVAVVQPGLDDVFLALTEVAR